MPALRKSKMPLYKRQELCYTSLSSIWSQGFAAYAAHGMGWDAPRVGHCDASTEGLSQEHGPWQHFRRNRKRTFFSASPRPRRGRVRSPAGGADKKRKVKKAMNEQKKSSPNKKLIIGVVCVALLAVVLFVVWRMTAPKGTAGGKQITVQVIHKDSSTKDFDLSTDQEFLGRALVEGGVVEDNQGAYGLYILTADGETVNEDNQEWWQVTRSGEYLMTGADETPIADGEHYELTLIVGW